MTKNLDQLTSAELGLLFPIILSPPNPDWHKIFINEKNILTEKIGTKNIFKIEHVGSTSIPDFTAKPTIDIILGINKKKDLEKFIIEKMKKANYYYIPKPENPPPHMLFVKGYIEDGFKGQAYHVHVRYPGKWDEVVFRDYLIQHPKAQKEYLKLKQMLTKKFRNDRDAYTKGKTDFVKKILNLAKGFHI